MHKTTTCGTVRFTRKQVPDLSGKLEQGETSLKFSENMLAVRWKDRREVTMLTTMHEDKIVQLNKKRQTPELT